VVAGHWVPETQSAPKPTMKRDHHVASQEPVGNDFGRVYRGRRNGILLTLAESSTAFNISSSNGLTGSSIDAPLALTNPLISFSPDLA
jgi:hypothetical protein